MGSGGDKDKDKHKHKHNDRIWGRNFQGAHLRRILTKNSCPKSVLQVQWAKYDVRPDGRGGQGGIPQGLLWTTGGEEFFASFLRLEIGFENWLVNINSSSIMYKVCKSLKTD